MDKRVKALITNCCAQSGRLGAFVGFALDVAPLCASIAGLLLDVTVLVVVVVVVMELGAEAAVTETSVSPILAKVAIVAGGGKETDGGDCGEDVDLEGGGISRDKSDCGCGCDVDGVKANLNFFRCLLVCFECSHFAWARRRKTKGSGMLPFGSEISFVHSMLPPRE